MIGVKMECNLGKGDREEWAGKEGPTNETRKVQSEKEKETPVSGGGGASC